MSRRRAVWFSLRGRLLLAATLLLACFLGLAGLALERAWRSSALAALESELLAQVYALLAATEIGPDETLLLPEVLPESRLVTPGSALFALVLDRDGNPLWRSPSALGRHLPALRPLRPGERDFRRVEGESGAFHVLRFGVAWETAQDTTLRLTYVVAVEEALFEQQAAAFRRTLALWLGAAALILLLAQGLILGLGLRPLARIEKELEAIETGRRQAITGRYPQEIARLADRLNAFIHSERCNQERYRNTLGDLAHSLKTPLSVLRGVGEKARLDAGDRALIREEAARMGEIVDYQLKRAESAGGGAVVQVTPVRPVLEKILRSLEKVYADKQVAVELEVGEEALFYGDTGDLFEMAGNLLDNAFKWCRGRVRVAAEGLPGERSRHPGLLLAVHDDGPGMPAAVARAVTARGVRGDERTPGQGIGLALVREIAGSYGGELEIGRSRLGGARVSLRFGPGS